MTSSSPSRVFLGLGSNLGDRIAALVQAIRALSEGPDAPLSSISVSELFQSAALMPDGAPAWWDIPFFNIVISGECRLEPEALLGAVKGIERKIGRKERERWAPREIDIDIIGWGDLCHDTERLTIPHRGVAERPFVLMPLMSLAPEYRFPERGAGQGRSAAQLLSFLSSSVTAQGGTARAAVHHQRRFFAELDPFPVGCRRVMAAIGELSETRLIGIINCTPDSFSDGGIYLDAASVRARALGLVRHGAAVIDVGAESTRPGAHALTWEEEWERLLPVLRTLHEIRAELPQGTLLSLDSRHWQCASRAIEFGVDWLNDVSGFHEPEMIGVARDCACDLVVMHSLGIPPSPEKIVQGDPCVALMRWQREHLTHLEQQGIARERMVLDPGIGFGKSAEQSLELVRNARCLWGAGQRLLFGHSRKSFLKLFTDKPPLERDFESALVSSHLARCSVDYLRVHDVALSARALKLSSALSH